MDKRWKKLRNEQHKHQQEKRKRRFNKKLKQARVFARQTVAGVEFFANSSIHLTSRRFRKNREKQKNLKLHQLNGRKWWNIPGKTKVVE